MIVHTTLAVRRSTKNMLPPVYPWGHARWAQARTVGGTLIIPDWNSRYPWSTRRRRKSPTSRRAPDELRVVTPGPAVTPTDDARAPTALRPFWEGLFSRRT